MAHSRNQGISLVEVSVVLVIIGLLAGAVIAGQALMKSSQLQSVLSDVDRFKTAVGSFRDKYKEFPGDMPNATNYWGTDAGCPATPSNVLPKKETCNGNGDGYIGDTAGSVLGGAGNWYETYRLWQHLANSGFIEGQYSGAYSSLIPGIDANPGINLPASKVTPAGYSLLNGGVGAAGGVFNAQYHHVIVFGTPGGNNVSNYKPAITTDEALMLDQKADDGMPGMGHILSFTSALAATPNCATGTTENTAQYKVASTGIQCSLIFITGF